MNFLNEMRALAVSLYGGGYANEVLLKTNYIAREIEDAKSVGQALPDNYIIIISF